MMIRFHEILILVCLSCFSLVAGEAIQLTGANFNESLSGSQLVLVNFYANWCGFSQRLMPVWDSLAATVANKYPKERVLVAKVDSVQEANLANVYRVNKYPTIKLFFHRHMLKQEYRGGRTEQALVAFIDQQLQNPVRTINDTGDAVTEDQVIGYFDSAQSTGYTNYVQVAMALRDQCSFSAVFGADASGRVHGRAADSLSVARSGTDLRIVMPDSVSLTNIYHVIDWLHPLCTPTVRKLTFDNAEGLTEEGNPFLILFHRPGDHDAPKRFEAFVERHLMEETASLTFLTADGELFSHPLAHLGKSMNDLPLIAIDSFKHMYIFPDMSKMETPGALKSFIDDLHSGELHRSFHYGPSTATPASASASAAASPTTTPPKSIFSKLAPSNERYTLPRDEL